MSKKSTTVRIFSVQKSAKLKQWLLIIHSIAAFSCLANGLPWFYQLIALIAVGCSLWFYLRHYHTRFQPYQIKHDEDSCWSIADHNGDFHTFHILPSSVITIWLMVLHVQFDNGKRQNWLICNDALSEKEYRALVVNLKFLR